MQSYIRVVLAGWKSATVLAVLLFACGIAFPQNVPDAPSRPALHSKSFVIPHAIMFASIVYDGELSRALHHDGPGGICRETNSWFAGPHGQFEAGRFYAYNLSLAAASTLTSYWLHRKYPRRKLFRVLIFGFPL